MRPASFVSIVIYPICTIIVSLQKQNVNRVQIDENHKFVRGQTISGNCGTHIIGWPRYWLTYLMWKPLSLANFIYTAFVRLGKTGHLTKVCLIYTNVYLQAFKNQSINTLSTITLYQGSIFLIAQLLCFVILDTYSRMNSMKNRYKSRFRRLQRLDNSTPRRRNMRVGKLSDTKEVIWKTLQTGVNTYVPEG